MGAETVPSPDVVHTEITNQKNLYCYVKKKCISEKEISLQTFFMYFWFSLFFSNLVFILC